jgi:DNA-directed RNA polymerase subunit M/transcription elongation factor TFIIS
MGRLYYCKCGHKIWVEWHWNGLADIPVFIDSTEDGPTVGQEIDSCPRCGDALDGVQRLMTEREYYEYCEALAEQEALAAAAEAEAAAEARARAECHQCDAGGWWARAMISRPRSGAT